MRDYLLHVATALGSGLAAFCIAVPTITTDRWYVAASQAGLAALGALGISVAYKVTPA